MNTDKIPRVVLCILDGWGANESDYFNPVINGLTPTIDYLNANFPPVLINASAGHVGLPEGQMGNSEVGHLNIGAGRVVLQDLPRIDTAIRDGSFFTNAVIDAGMKTALERGANYHLLGLLSDGGVHSHINHIEAFLEKAGRVGLKNVFIHALTDGRDTPPDSGIEYVRRLEGIVKKIGVGKIATVSGRYYTMDRDKRWDRVEKGFNALVHGKGIRTASDPVSAMKSSYDNNVTDEFVEPTVITSNGQPTATLGDGGVLQAFNFRADRMRQILHALTDDTFDGFDRGKLPKIDVVTLTEYDETFPFPVAFDNNPPRNGIGELLSGLGLAQFRTAETEKYAHVTFFFNGGIEKTYPLEERNLIPSPKVATYDLQPEMSAFEVTDGVVGAVESKKFPLVVVNLANGDMVGHTGIYEAALKAVETIDTNVARIMEAVKKAGSTMIITADHGNIEEMKNKSGQPITSHTTNPVPFYVYKGSGPFTLDDRSGALCDIAPTILSLMGIEQPAEMTGAPLIKSK